MATITIHGQEFRFHEYRVENGLPSDVIKAVAQDSLGFFWIATDDGLVKYDGLHFHTYKNAFLSQYTKGFLKTHDGRLLAFGDLDLIEIQNRIDTVFFKKLIRGARTLTDTTLWYAKSIYEDKEGLIWLGESQSILAYNGKTFNRYDFGMANRSPVFVRSFSFFEDNEGQLYTISYQGKVYRYDRSTRSFLQLKSSLPASISHVIYNNGVLWIASEEGIYRATFQSGELQQLQRAFPIMNASHLLMAADSSLWISTFGQDVYHVRPDSASAPVEALLFNFNSVNSAYFSEEGDLWIASDKGLVIAQKNQFTVPDLNSEAHFIEDIADDPETKSVYYCYKETLIQLHPLKDGRNWEAKVIYNNKDNYFQSLQFGKRGLWASSAFDILLFKNGAVQKRWDFSQEGNFVHDIFLDSHDNVWLGQARSPTLKVINNDLQIERYKIPLGSQSEINLVREGSRGIYVASSGVDAYLFLKENGSHEFKNISLPVHFKVISDFSISDLAVQNDVLWIASTEGLLRYDHQTIRRIDLGSPLTYVSVSSVEVMDDRNILFSNSFGLIRYNITTGEYWLYNENAGLPSNTITARGIHVDHEKRIWVGTSFGLASSVQSIMGNKPTLKPYCVSAQVNGKRKEYVDGLDAPYGSFINLEFSPITFPENKITMQYRIDSEATWHTFESSELSLSNLSFGKHTLHVRARKNTGLGWSEVTSLAISIGQPYWLSDKFIFGAILIALFIIWVTFSISSYFMKKRRFYLQQLVTERTHDLQRANEELMQRNSELDRFVYSASHDLSAPLKSILGLIMVARMDKSIESHETYLSMMESSVRKLEEFIEEVVSYSRNSRMPVKLEKFSFREFVQNLLLDHQYAPSYNKILFMINDRAATEMVSDVTRLKIILNNLISNAIKFYWTGGDRKPFVCISLEKSEKQYVITIEDNGIGIGNEHLAHIFDMFYRANEDAQGSGLGLYILKESVAKLGGTVQATSVLGEGTVFTISLPVQEVSE
ncbi:sensor histidine kinase [Ohtaekwangia sp.]|uniref:sensor histidine kinase n=1 Tax=Ohtaekwangia sp. TaxID=2066019 RepID=UPI002F93A12B